MKIYGIPNCNTVKKTLGWLKDHHLEFEFHDFKKLGVSLVQLDSWSQQVGWEALINKRGTTWKKLDSEIQESIISKELAFKLMQEKTSVIKRPVIETESGTILLGFDENQLLTLIK